MLLWRASLCRAMATKLVQVSFAIKVSAFSEPDLRAARTNEYALAVMMLMMLMMITMSDGKEARPRRKE